MNKIIGKPLDRVDGRLKVTGEAPYTADVPIENLAYGVIFQSAIASGKIIQIDTTAAAIAPGVLDIVTYQQTPSLVKIPFFGPPQPQSTEKDHNIYYDGQHLGVVIAQTLEQAETAAS